MKRQKLKLVGASVLTSAVLLAGCGLVPGKEEVAAPKNNETSSPTVNEKKVAPSEKELTGVRTQLYLIDKQGLVIPQTLVLPDKQGVTKQALEYLVADGPVEEMLPNGFRSVLPAGTMVLGVDISKDGTTAIVDFSKEFTNYKMEDEQRILQSITWTVTQFDKVQNVQIRVNGRELKEMPVGKTPIGTGVSRADGINMDYKDVMDVTNTRSITVYYIAQSGKETYYVPVTKRVSNEVTDNYTAVVQELIKGPSPQSGLVTDFNSDVQLLDDPTYENGKVTLNFNENIFGIAPQKLINDYVMNALVLSLTEQPGVESVAIQVNGKYDAVSEEGAKLSKAVSRPHDVNTGSF